MGRLDKKRVWSKCKDSGVTRYKMSRIVEVGQVVQLPKVRLCAFPQRDKEGGRIMCDQEESEETGAGRNDCANEC